MNAENSLTCPTPQLEWREGQLATREFDDMYFATSDGPQESDFVFYKGADIDNWIDTKDHVVIAETGFGTGLNFFVCWQKFLQKAASGQRLTFVSFERYPLDSDTLRRAMGAFPVFCALVDELLAQYPAPAPGTHPVTLSKGRVQLLLVYGDLNTTFPGFNAQVDAWFLDGFAPSRNPDMWSDTLFKGMAQNSHEGTTVATFSAAGVVKRGLVDHGFEIRKAPGYGRKRERIVARFTGARFTGARFTGAHHQAKPQWWHSPPPSHEKKIAIIGAGIAGRLLARALLKRGMDTITVIGDPEQQAASHVPAALVAPRFQLDPKPYSSAFLTSAFICAVQDPDYKAAQHHPTGLVLGANSDQDHRRLERVASACNWGKNWIDLRDDGLWFPMAGSYDTQSLLESSWPKHQHMSMAITDLQQDNRGWTLYSGSGDMSDPYTDVVFATGAGGLTHPVLPVMKSNWGEVITIAHASTSPTPTALSAGGYMTAVYGDDCRRSYGATSTDRMHEDGPEAAAARLNKRFGPSSPLRGPNLRAASIWQGQRANFADHLPAIGPLLDSLQLQTLYADLQKDKTRTPDVEPPWRRGLWAMTGFGSKGFQYAPYCAEILADQITGTPLSCDNRFLPYLHPNRFEIRDIIRASAQDIQT